MPATNDLLVEDCEIASDIKQRVLEELHDEIVLDRKTLDALVRGLASLLRSP